MRLGEYAKWYLRSPLGIGGVFAGIACAAGLMLASVPALVALPAGIALAAAIGGIAFAAGAGPRLAVAARDADDARTAAGKIARAEAARDTLARMRIADPEVSMAVQLVAQAAGAYIEACRKEKTRDPLADAAIDEAREIVDIYLREKDEDSTEKRFGLEDEDAFPDAKRRVISALREKALLLRERRIQIDGGLPPKDQLSIREDLK